MSDEGISGLALHDLISTESLKTCQKGLDFCIEEETTVRKELSNMTREKKQLETDLVTLKGQVSLLESQVGEAEKDRENVSKQLKQAQLDYQTCKNEKEEEKSDHETQLELCINQEITLGNVTTEYAVLEYQLESCRKRVQKVTDRENDLFNRYNLLSARVLSCSRAMYGEEWHRLVCQGNVAPSYLQVIFRKLIVYCSLFKQCFLPFLYRLTTRPIFRKKV